ncbi:C-type mannose receptor 2-like [Toxotes jaculatrix]|uniref:C-type mannose receptor 2-like n=1 Tax=Toxotes jaculatrix TaxID=941984 RepID=UPI001B3B054D|nr:C-type mannose receptor 2-like [Toxotes jaculatrix]XP_040918977.1 C-type mannose receptor 2-like [Toxotes jaculatrix]XP_040918978.1 C-type mannose receptor 2-like [Toxotes jaculatrix]
MVWKICILAPLLLLLLPSVFMLEVNMRTEHFIHYIPAESSWWNAQAFCRREHTDLVTISSKEDNKHFIRGRGWIGLRREDSRSPWKWSSTGEEAVFTIWKQSLVDLDSEKNCAFKKPNEEEWENDHCDGKHSFMCFDKKLVLVNQNETWEEALNYCRAMAVSDTDGSDVANQNHIYDLATLTTEDDHAYAREIAQEATTDEVWTGLRYLAGQWEWVGGGQVSYEGIESCPAETFCGVLEKNGTAPFRMRDCKQKMNFLCYLKFELKEEA